MGVWPVSPLSTLSARDLSQAISPVHSGGASGLPGERVLAAEALGRARPLLAASPSRGPCVGAQPEASAQ